MHYLIGRDIDGDGYPEYISNMDSMTLTEDPRRALQFTEMELRYIDMAYFNQMGFYAIEAERYNIPFAQALLWHAVSHAFRPRVAPPPRRPRGPMPRGPMYGPGYGAPMHGHAPRGPMPRGPVAGPGPRGPMGGPGMDAGRGPGVGPMSGPIGRGPGGRGPGGYGPGGRGPMGGPGR